MLAKKSMKPEKAALKYICTNRRIKTLVESIADDLIGKSLLVVEQHGSLLKAKLCHVDTTVIAEDIAAIKHMDRTATSDQTNLAALLLESGTAKKMLNKQELSILKKTAKQVDSDFQTYVKKVKKMFRAVKAIIYTSIGSSAGAAGR